MRFTYFISCSLLYPRLIYIASVNINYREKFLNESTKKRLKDIVRELMEHHETIATRHLGFCSP